MVDQWYWTFGDGGTASSQHPTHTYTTAGLFNVTQRVTDTATGEWDAFARTGYITVTPVASFTASPRQTKAGLTVQFTAPAQRCALRGAWDTSTSGVDQWHWAFGDTGVIGHIV